MCKHTKDSSGMELAKSQMAALLGNEMELAIMPRSSIGRHLSNDAAGAGVENEEGNAGE
jgi:hypothetical protein